MPKDPRKDPKNRHSTFSGLASDRCWQYDIRVRNYKQDLTESGISEEQAKALSVTDFSFSYAPNRDRAQCQMINQFIKRHEWLGKMPNRPTHRFCAYLKLPARSVLAGALVMAIPNHFSHLLGPDTLKIEKLISRGCCISWSPKNLGSWLIMQSIRWMVNNTQFRLFTAYSDPEAGELGTIYQACNFIYLGKPSRTANQYLYFDPDNPKQGWFSDREFRKRSKYARYARNIGLTKKEWAGYMKKWSPNWEDMPSEMAQRIKGEERKHRESCLKRRIPAKHKYCYILAPTRTETKEIKRRLFELNPHLIGLTYPKERGR